jgi:hypothetical protein
MRAIARVYPRSKAARYRNFSKPAFPADPGAVHIRNNDGVLRQPCSGKIGP